jgi:hypothetical protein
MQYLRTFRSEEIRKIEIIPQATAEFSAEGSGGVLRIITKRVVEKGWQGRIGSTASYSYKVTISPQVAFQYSGNKLGIRCVMSIDEERNQGYSRTRTQDKGSGIAYDMENENKELLRSYSPTITMNYDFNQSHRLVFSGFAGKYNYDVVNDQRTNVIEGEDVIGHTYNDYKSRQDVYTYIGSMNYDWLLDSLGRQKITWLVKYLRQPKYNQDERFIYQNRDSAGELESEEEFLHEQDRPNIRYYVEVQYAHDFGKRGSGLAGIKYGHTSAENVSKGKGHETIEGIEISRPGFGYNYQYKERSVAPFYRYDLSGKGWSLNVGLRGEYADRKAEGGYDYKILNFLLSM